MTFKLEPLFKRSITYEKRGDGDLAEAVVCFGKQYEFADITWYPGTGKALYRKDSRVSLNDRGDGQYDFLGFRSTSVAALDLDRSTGSSSKYLCFVLKFFGIRESKVREKLLSTCFGVFGFFKY